MHHRRFGFGRVFIFLLLIGGLIAIGRGRYRSGFEDGFMRGMAFAAVDGRSGAATPDSAAVPPAYAAPWGREFGPGGFGPGRGGFPLGFGLLGLAFVAFTAMMIMGGIGRRHRGHHSWGHHGPPEAWGHHGHRSRGCGPHASSDEVGPENQPEDIA